MLSIRKTITTGALALFVILGIQSAKILDDTIVGEGKKDEKCCRPVHKTVPSIVYSSLDSSVDEDEYPFFIEADNRAERGSNEWVRIANGDSVIEGVNH